MAEAKYGRGRQQQGRKDYRGRWLTDDGLDQVSSPQRCYQKCLAAGPSPSQCQALCFSPWSPSG